MLVSIPMHMFKVSFDDLKSGTGHLYVYDRFDRIFFFFFFLESSYAGSRLYDFQNKFSPQLYVNN